MSDQPKKHHLCVVTYQSPRGNKIDLCPACEKELKKSGNWPKDAFGEEYCNVLHGLHMGYCSRNPNVDQAME